MTSLARGVTGSSRTLCGASFATQLTQALDEARMNVFEFSAKSGIRYRDLSKWLDSRGKPSSEQLDVIIQHFPKLSVLKDAQRLCFRCKRPFEISFKKQAYCQKCKSFAKTTSPDVEGNER